MKQRFIFYVLILISARLFCQSSDVELSNLNYSWSTVTSGKILSKPVLTSYGFAAVTDAKTLIGVSENGTILFEKKLPGANSQTKITSLKSDIILCVSSSGKKLTLINPSGRELWRKNLSWQITQNPFEGRDGRFFVRGKDKLACFGINGLEKWEIETESQSELSLQELNDGSILIFLEKNVENKTRAIRVSPFGEVLEEITFSGIVSSAGYSQEGVFLTFTDGSAGLFSVENNSSKNKWILQYKSEEKNHFFVTDLNSQKAYLIDGEKNGITALQVNSKSGQIEEKFTFSDLNIKSLESTKIVDGGLFLCDKNVALYSDKNGKITWSGKFPKPTKSTRWNYAFYTNDDHMVLCRENWSVDAWKVRQNLEKSANTKSQDSKNENSYKSYYKIDTSLYDYGLQKSIDKKLKSSERIEELQNGMYGPKEIEYTSELYSAITAYLASIKKSDFGTRLENNAFQNDTAGLETIVTELGLLQTDDAMRYVRQILLYETNQSILCAALKAIQENGCDSDGETLQALLKFTSKVTKNTSESTLSNLCEAVLSICKYMGRPAFNRTGKSILKQMMNPIYPTQARSTARKCLLEFGEFELEN